MDRATCCSNILREDIVDEDDRFLITFDVERRHSFDVIDDYSVIEVRVWVNYVLEEIAWRPFFIDTDLELELLGRIITTEQYLHLIIIKIKEWLVLVVFCV